MFLLIAILLTITVSNASSSQIRSLDEVKNTFTDIIWTWECVEKGCRKVSVKSNCMNNEENSDCVNGTFNKPLLGEEVCHLMCPPGNLWPLPTGEQQISTTFVYIETGNIVLNLQPANSLREEKCNDSKNVVEEVADLYFKRFQKLGTKEKKYDGLKRGVVLNLFTLTPGVYKHQLGADESYNLHVSPSTENMMNVTIVGNTFLGVRHGLETLSQLLVVDSITGSVVAPSEVYITDKPKYTHRGITLDTARNYISIPAILRTIDAMSSVKLNTFHWHITDSHSFPFVSRSNPLFSKYGAYSPEKVYTEDDIKLVVEYAQLRGVRVVPELDLPAHVGEGWQAAPGAVVCFNAQPWTTYCVEPPCGQVDPTSELVFDVLKGLYTDLNRAFDADLFHMGGDEVNLRCWNSTESIVNNMNKLNLERTVEGFHEIWSKFQNRAKELVKETGGQNKQFVLWTSSLTEENLENHLNNTEYIIQVWTKGNDQTIANLLRKNFRIILSNYEALYFDCGFGAWVGTGNNWCSPYIPWQKVYENTPERVLHNLKLDKEYERFILGSEAALWTEQADDSSLDNRLWPRGAALAESVWSPGRAWSTAEKRYLIQRERFVRRGILADTVEPEWCRQNQGYCYL